MPITVFSRGPDEGAVQRHVATGRLQRSGDVVFDGGGQLSCSPSRRAKSQTSSHKRTTLIGELEVGCAHALIILRRGPLGRKTFLAT
jgi:hypothetical protein